jgi:tetratricopeptide (TPR) repeat protein
MSRYADPRVEDALHSADSLEEAGEIGAAINALSDAIDIAPGDPRLFALRGRLFHLDGQWRKAIRDFDQALALKPDAATTLYFRGRARSMIDDLDGAIEDFEGCIKLQPHSADAFCEIGHIYYFRGQWRQSEAAFRRAVELEPERGAALEEQLREIVSRLRTVE